jgi:hypothetical protein
LFTVLGKKFKFSAQDSDLEYLFWQQKNSPVSSELKPPLIENGFKSRASYNGAHTVNKKLQ